MVKNGRDSWGSTAQEGKPLAPHEIKPKNLQRIMEGDLDSTLVTEEKSGERAWAQGCQVEAKGLGFGEEMLEIIYTPKAPEMFAGVPEISAT